MHHLKSAGLAIATICICLSPSIPTVVSPAIAQTAIAQNQKAEEGSAALREANRLFEQGNKQLEQKQYQEALKTFQQALVIYQKVGERQQEGHTLRSIGNIYFILSDYAKSLEYQQQTLVIAREIKDLDLEGRTLNNLGNAYKGLKNITKAIELYNQSLSTAKAENNFKLMQIVLGNLGRLYQGKSESIKAIEYYQQLILTARDAKEKYSQASTLSTVGDIYSNDLKDYRKAIESYQKGLQISEEIKDYVLQIDILLNIANTTSLFATSQVDHQKATKFAQQGLKLAESTNSLSGKARAFAILGTAQYYLKDYEKSISYLQQATKNAQEAHEGWREARLLNQIGDIYNDSLNDYHEAIRYYQQGLKVAEKIQERELQIEALLDIANSSGQITASQTEYQRVLKLAQKGLKLTEGTENFSARARAFAVIADLNVALKDYAEAIKNYQQSIATAKQAKDSFRESKVLNALGSLYANQFNDYPEAIKYFQQALRTAQKTKNPQAEIIVLVNLSDIYFLIGNYPGSVESAERIKTINQNIKDPAIEAIALLSLTSAYYGQGDVRAEKVLQQSLIAAQQAKNPLLEAISTAYLGWWHTDAESYSKAYEFTQRSLSIARNMKNRDIEGLALYVLGNIYRKQRQFDQSIAAYREVIGSKSFVYSYRAKIGIAQVYQDLNMPVSAIAYYKQAINQIEKIRSYIQKSSPDSQQLFLQAVQGLGRQKTSEIYRQLAELLLTQGRILEAQEVLELLKVQELKDFDPIVRAKVDKNGKTIELDAAEKTIIAKHTTYITFAQQLKQCEDKNDPCEDLRRQRKQAKDEYEKVVKSFEQALQDRKANDEKNFLDPKNPLNAKAQEIIKAQPNTALIYTLVTDKRLWIVLATQSEVLRSFEVDVSQKQLSDKVQEFRDLMKRCEKNPCTAADTAAFKAVSQQLYIWLFPKDLQTELQGTKDVPKIEHLVFALDRVTRYIPMSALFNGQKYLIQDYTVATIVSADSTRSERLPTDSKHTKVLALGLSAAKPPDFPYPLPAVEGELNAILRDETDNRDKTGRFPGRKFLNQQFTAAILEQYLPNRQILHIATHGQFVGGIQEQSYILLGNGSKLKISEMLALYGLPGVNLVVLSACQTALASQTADGIEISSVGNAFFEKGVKSVVASLWNVSDASTGLLMQEFYRHLAEGKTKSEAMRQAQLDLMTGKKTEKDAPRGGDAALVVTAKPGKQLPVQRSPDYTHPYYWAPFILIGNGL
ncbi:MAG: CHAT domain-containing protein [Tildeniella nuda ZEHNDER 1965/U140]|jgi:CHAT domain-containing protein/bacterioferritin (cytochrome b1)|nr:CHAT domain-containing protein [Tildeniella nuda ZEHNDER 1965/U140]